MKSERGEFDIASPSPHFNSKRDKDIVANSGFYCEACLIGRPATEQSPDPRYCQSCFDYLALEAQMLDGNRSPAWIPKAQKPQERPQKLCKISGDVSPIMFTLGNRKIEVDKIQPRPMSENNKRGRKHRELPDELILGFANEGMGSKAIATKLKKKGIVVSYKTIQRLLFKRIE